MNKFIVLALCLTVAASYEVVQSDDGQSFFLVPLHRQRRQTSVQVDQNGAAVNHRGTILNDGRNVLQGGGFASKPFRGHPTVGGDLQYSHVPSGSNANLNVQRTGGYGTDVGVGGTANLWRQGNNRLDAVGNYNRHFGAGGGRHDYYGGVQFRHKF